MRSERHLADRAEVVEPVQMRAARRRVVPAHEHVDRVRLAGAERVREGAPDPRRCRRGTQGIEVADLVEPDVALDEFSKLDCVACVGFLL